MSVDWPVELTVAGVKWGHDPDEEKAVELKPHQFAEAKALVPGLTQLVG